MSIHPVSVPDVSTPDPEAYLDKREGAGYLDKLFEVHGEPFRRYRVLWEAAVSSDVIPNFPLHIEFELTNYCNLRCRMCQCARYSHDSTNKRHFSLELLDRVLDQCQGRLPAALVGASSECLLHPEIETILTRMSQAGIMDLMVHTNGLLLTERLAEFFVALPLSRLNISMDAVTPETYKSVRGGRLEVLEANLERVLALRNKATYALPYVRLTYVKCPENLHEMDAFLAKWQDRVDRIDFQEMIHDRSDSEASVVSGVRSCVYPNRMLYVDYNGDVFPCCSFYCKQLKVGNVYETTLEDIWNSRRMQSLRQSLRNRNFPSACRVCLSY